MKGKMSLVFRVEISGNAGSGATSLFGETESDDPASIDRLVLSKLGAAGILAPGETVLESVFSPDGRGSVKTGEPGCDEWDCQVFSIRSEPLLAVGSRRFALVETSLMG